MADGCSERGLEGAGFVLRSDVHGLVGEFLISRSEPAIRSTNFSRIPYRLGIESWGEIVVGD